jgi:hypothetical protein
MTCAYARVSMLSLAKGTWLRKRSHGTREDS